MNSYLDFIFDTSATNFDRSAMVIFFVIVHAMFVLKLISEKEAEASRLTDYRAEESYRFMHAYAVMLLLNFVGVIAALFFINTTALMFVVGLMIPVTYVTSYAIEKVWTAIIRHAEINMKHVEFNPAPSKWEY